MVWHGVTTTLLFVFGSPWVVMARVMELDAIVVYVAGLNEDGL